jgi:hypothetical protein
VRVVAELAQHPRTQHHPKPGLATNDRGVPMVSEPGGELLLQRRNLAVQAAQYGHQDANDLAVGSHHRLGRGQIRL